MRTLLKTYDWGRVLVVYFFALMNISQRNELVLWHLSSHLGNVASFVMKTLEVVDDVVCAFHLSSFKHNINSSIKLYLSFRSSQIEADMSYQ